MNTLTVIKIQMNEYSYQYSVAVDGIPLYKYFEECMDDDISDSVSIPFTDPHDLEDLVLLWECNFYWKGNEDFIWFLTDSQEEEVLPLLSCPECAEEMDCLLLCALVKKDGEHVYWERIGRIRHAENESEQMIQYGFKCKDVLSDKDCDEYGADTPVAEVDDWWVWEHWREELFKRELGFLRSHYKTPDGVKWLKDVNWIFSVENYREVVDFFRNLLSEQEEQ